MESINTTINDIPDSQPGYPIENFGYPFSENLDSDQKLGPNFAFNKPIRPDDTTVSGTGPSNVPIVLVDVSEIGEVLSETMIDKNGNFIFYLDKSLVSGHLVGIQLGDLTGTDLDPNDFVFSPTYFDKPLIGILFDMALVSEGD